MIRAKVHLMRLLALITILTTTHSWSKVQKLAPKMQSYDYHSAFEDSVQDFTAWAFQVLMCAVAALYSAGVIDYSEGSSSLQAQPSGCGSGLPFSRGILQTCLVWAIVNQFFYPQLAIAFLTAYWKLQENYGNYCLGVNIIWTCLYAIKAYLFVQEFTLSTLPDEVLRYSLAILQIIVGLTHDNIWISIGGVLMFFAVAINPGSVLVRFMPFEEFQEYLLFMAIAAICQSTGFSRMVGQMRFEQIYHERSFYNQLKN